MTHHRWQIHCSEVWPRDPARWCPSCADAYALDFPRVATPEEQRRDIRNAVEWHLERRKGATT